MQPKYKIVPCLDLKDGRVVKGVKFEDIKDAGDPAEFAAKYSADGADEIVMLDISATIEGRKTTLEVIARAAQSATVPITVGGGISELEDIEKILASGASKVSIGSAAVKNPAFVKSAVEKFGGEKIVCAIDYQLIKGKYEVLINGGKTPTGIDARAFAKNAENMGAGELLVTSKDFDGTKKGYDIKFLKILAGIVSIPITASGGAGKIKDFLKAAKAGATGLLAASLFHFGKVKIPELKEYLKSRKA